MKTTFEEPGTFPKAGPIGRTVRLGAGVVILLIIAVSLLPHLNDITAPRPGSVIPPQIIPGFLLAIWLLPRMIDRGFTLEWGHRSQIALALLALGAAALGLASYGNLWAPPLGWLVFLTILYTFGHLGLSFLVAGIFAAPG